MWTWGRRSGLALGLALASGLGSELVLVLGCWRRQVLAFQLVLALSSWCWCPRSGLVLASVLQLEWVSVSQ